MSDDIKPSLETTPSEALPPVKRKPGRPPRGWYETQHWNARKEKFLQAYWACGNATQAYKDAGYVNSSKHAAQTAAYMMLYDKSIQARLKDLSEKNLENLKNRRGRLIEELSKVAYADIRDVLTVDQSGAVSINDFSKTDTSTIQSIKETRNGVQVTMYDKLRALDLLAEVSGLKTQQIDITSAGKPINQAPVNITFEVVKQDTKKDITGDSTVT